VCNTRLRATTSITEPDSDEVSIKAIMEAWFGYTEASLGSASVITLYRSETHVQIQCLPCAPRVDVGSFIRTKSMIPISESRVVTEQRPRKFKLHGSICRVSDSAHFGRCMFSHLPKTGSSADSLIRHLAPEL
jgi:hypothetical protein